METFAVKAEPDDQYLYGDSVKQKGANDTDEPQAVPIQESDDFAGGDDEEDDVQVRLMDATNDETTIGDANEMESNSATVQIQAKTPKIAAPVEPKKVPGKPVVNVHAVGHYQGKPITELDISALDDMPWRRPGADITDFFNYGFDEDTWKVYCDKQRQIRACLQNTGHSGGLDATTTAKIMLIAHGLNAPQVNVPPQMQQQQMLNRPKFAPRMETKPGVGQISVIGTTPVDSRRPITENQMPYMGMQPGMQPPMMVPGMQPLGGVGPGFPPPGVSFMFPDGTAMPSFSGPPPIFPGVKTEPGETSEAGGKPGAELSVAEHSDAVEKFLSSLSSSKPAPVVTIGDSSSTSTTSGTTTAATSKTATGDATALDVTTLLSSHPGMDPNQAVPPQPVMTAPMPGAVPFVGMMPPGFQLPPGVAPPWMMQSGFSEVPGGFVPPPMQPLESGQHYDRPPTYKRPGDEDPTVYEPPSTKRYYREHGYDQEFDARAYTDGPQPGGRGSTPPHRGDSRDTRDRERRSRRSPPDREHRSSRRKDDSSSRRKRSRSR